MKSMQVIECLAPGEINNNYDGVCGPYFIKGLLLIEILFFLSFSVVKQTLIKQ